MPLAGLVYAEALRLTPVQWAALGLNAAGWLWWYSRSPFSISNYQLSIVNGELRMLKGWGLTALLTFSGLWYAFWNQPTSIDQQMLFEQAHYLARFAWPEFLERIAGRPYVEYQPPFLTFWFSRTPVFWLHQIVMLPFGLLCAGLLVRLYGRQAALLCATPVFALMIHQPCGDTVLFGLLLVTQRLIQMGKPHPRPNPKEGKAITFSEKGCHCEESATKQSPDTGEIASQSLAMTLPLHQNVIALLPVGEGPGKRFRLLAAVVYGLTWPVKPLTLLTAPFMLPRLGWTGLLSLVMWAGYVIWSLRWPFGRRQAAFLLHQLMLRSMARRPSGPPPPPRPPRPVWFWLWQTVCWRWDHLGRQAVQALPLYIFPAYLRPWRWAGVLLAVIIMFGYGNLKYLLLSLVWVFPVTEEV